MAVPAALHDRILALAVPELELLGLELVEFDVLAGGHRFTLRFSLEMRLSAEDQELDAAAQEQARRVSAGLCARASRAIARTIEAEEAEHGEFLGRYTLEVSSPGIFRRLTRPEHFLRFVGEKIKLSYDQEGQTLQARGRLAEADATRVTVETEERGTCEIPLASIRRANLDPDLDFGRKAER